MIKFLLHPISYYFLVSFIIRLCSIQVIQGLFPKKKYEGRMSGREMYNQITWFAFNKK